MEKSPYFKTPLCRLAFADGLFSPRGYEDKPTFQASLLISKDSDIGWLQNQLHDLVDKQWGAQGMKMLKDGIIKSPILDGDGKQGMSSKSGTRHDGFENHWFIRVSTGVAFPPTLHNQLLEPATSEQLYSGCYVFSLIRLHTWTNEKQGRGVSVGLSAMQKVKDGARLGQIDTKSYFDPIAVDADQAFDSIRDAGDVESFADAQDLFQ